MRSSLARTAVGVLIAVTSACATVGSDHAEGPQLDRQRLLLSEGYSLLYIDSGHLDQFGLVLHVKAESDEVNQVITSISTYAGELKGDLERIARDYPGVRIDLDPLPEIEKRKRKAIAMDRARYFAPVVGHGGVEYERTMLISMVNALNHESHLCKVMAEEEPDAGLKKFLAAQQKRFEDLNAGVTALLEREYFTNGASAARHD